ncbi:MAG: hypothetical protein ABL921_04490 [Pirellula sp.]
MRRMMHAVAFLLLSASFAQAQTKLRTLPPLPPEPTTGRSVLVDETQPNDSIELSESQAQSVSTRHSAPLAAAHEPTELMAMESDRPYSQLASFMNCSQASPNLWTNYACERSAIIARINQHVDGQCGCSDSKRCLHATASSPCGDADCGPKLGNGQLRNRYKPSFATLHSATSDSCGPTCGQTSACGSNGGCGNSGCSTCNANAAGNQTFPASAKRISPILMAKPSRVPGSELIIQRAALPMPVTTPQFEARR